MKLIQRNTTELLPAIDERGIPRLVRQGMDSIWVGEWREEPFDNDEFNIKTVINGAVRFVRSIDFDLK